MKKGANSENALNENALSGALNSIDKVLGNISKSTIPSVRGDTLFKQISAALSALTY